MKRVGSEQNRQHDAIRGLARWNLDMPIGKQTTITEPDFTDPASFGVLTSQYNQPRFIQLGFRLEW